MEYTLEISGNILAILPTEPLITNRVHTITLMAGISGVYESESYALASDYTFWFTSLYCPLFTTVTKVKLEAGPGVDLISEDTIYRLIHKNSLDAVDLYNTYQGTSISYDNWGCTWHDVPMILRRYVECKTAYDLLALLDAAGLSTASDGTGSQLKTLGDLTISYGGSKAAGNPDMSAPDKKKQLYDCFMNALNIIRAKGIQPAVRGWYDTTKGYPHPTFNPDHNRVIRTVDFVNSQPHGPWERSRYWRSNI
jgi:hypothetical protein